jgi:TRAP-type C4-dicarboxylate transport system substrate-binding protein
MYSKFTVSSVNDIVGKKVRVQATKTEDAFFSAYHAIPVHMPFGQVYTSLQTGLIHIAENGNDVVLKNKHYEAAPFVSKTEHEANNSHIWVSQKTWDALNETQRKQIQQAADYALPAASRKALELSTAAIGSLQKVGVKFHEQVDKKSFNTIAAPLQDSQAQELGKHAVQLLALVRGIK